MADRRAWLLEWDPEQFGERWCSYKVDEEERSVLIPSEYAYCDCGNLWDIRPGDRVFLIRLDREPRGIVAGGMALSKVDSYTPWDPATGKHKQTVCRIDVQLEKMEYWTGRYIPVSYLEKLDPDVNWHSPCRFIPSETAEKLECLLAPASLQGKSMTKSYYEENLRGRTPEELQSRINELRHEIWRCEMLLSTRIREEGASHRGLSSRLKAAYRNLDRAREELTASGGVFVPTEGEQGDDEVNGKLSQLSRVSLRFGGSLRDVKYSAAKKEDGFFTIAYKEDRPREREEAMHNLCLYGIELDSYNKFQAGCARAGFRGKIPADAFLSGLAALHIGRWKKSYSLHDIIDGGGWGVTLEFEDGSDQYYHGSFYKDFPYAPTLSGLCRLLKAPSPDSWFY